MVSGSASQWALTTRIAAGLGSAADQAASCPGQTGSSTSGGAPCPRYSAGMRVCAAGVVTGYSFHRSGDRRSDQERILTALAKPVPSVPCPDDGDAHVRIISLSSGVPLSLQRLFPPKT